MSLIYIDSEELISGDFDEDKSIEDMKHVEAEISLSEVEDCYNLMLKISPVMITRVGSDGYFEVIYPEKKKYNVDIREGKYF